MKEFHVSLKCQVLIIIARIIAIKSRLCPATLNEHTNRRDLRFRCQGLPRTAIATRKAFTRKSLLISRLLASDAMRLFVPLSHVFPRERERGSECGRTARVIWNSRSKLSRRSVLEIDVMSARTGQDTGLLYLPRCPTRKEYRSTDIGSVDLLDRTFISFNIIHASLALSLRYRSQVFFDKL